MCNCFKRTVRLSPKANEYVPRSGTYASVSCLSAKATPFMPRPGTYVSDPATIVLYPKCTCNHPEFKYSGCNHEWNSCDKKKQLKAYYSRYCAESNRNGCTIKEVEYLLSILRNMTDNYCNT
jgi:hypothetical protein